MIKTANGPRDPQRIKPVITRVSLKKKKRIER
jgi:hypothetical protein